MMPFVFRCSHTATCVIVQNKPSSRITHMETASHKVSSSQRKCFQINLPEVRLDARWHFVREECISRRASGLETERDWRMRVDLGRPLTALYEITNLIADLVLCSETQQDSRLCILCS